MAAVVTRLITVFIIAAAVSFISRFPVEIAVKAMANSGVNIPEFLMVGIVPAGYLLSFILAGLITAKIILKEGDLDVLTQFLQDSQNKSDDDDDDGDVFGSGLGDWREDSAGSDPLGDLEDDIAEDEGSSAPASTASGMDYPPDNVPAEPRKRMLKFLELALSAIRGQLSKLDKLGKFGLNLYLAGAGDTLARHSGLDGAKRNGMISEAIVAIGILCAFQVRTISHLPGAKARLVCRIWRERLALTSSSFVGCITKLVNSSPSLETVPTTVPVTTSTILSSSPHMHTIMAPSCEAATLPPVYIRPWRSCSSKLA